MKRNAKCFVGVGAVALCFGLAACGGGGETPTHSHAWVWKSNEVEHYQICEEDNTERENSRSQHLDEDGDGKCDVCNRDVPLTADILVTFDANGGAFSGGELKKTVAADEDGKVSFSEIPVFSSMHFVGWSKQNDNEQDGVLVLEDETFEESFSLYAVWEEAYTEGLKFTALPSEEGATSYSVSVGTAEGDIVIPSTYHKLPVTAIEEDAFYGTGITSVSVPASVKEIGDYAFSSCEALRHVTFAEGSELKTIGYAAFWESTALEEIEIPAGVGELPEDAFCNCYALESVTYEEGSELSSIADFAFYECRSLRTAYILSSVKTVGDRAFMRCTGLDAVVVEDLLSWFEIEIDDTVGSDPLYYAQDFYVLDELQEDLVIPDGVTRIRSLEFYYYKGFGTITIPDTVTEIGRNAFYLCPSKVVWAGTPTIQTIGQSAFNLYHGNELVIPSSVRTIGKSAFASSALISVTIPASVQEIGEKAFSGCNHLVEVFNLSGIQIKRGDSTGLNFDVVKTYVEGSETSHIATDGDFTFYDDGTNVLLVRYTGNDPSPTLPSTHNGKSYNIGCGAFLNNTDLISVKIPSGVAEIGKSAFEGCRNLTRVTIPSTVKTIKDYAFTTCTSLVEVHILSSSFQSLEAGSPNAGRIAQYAKHVYTDETTMGSIVTEDGFTFYDDGVKVYLLNYRGESRDLVLPADYEGESYEINNYAFQDNATLSSVSIPEGVTAIGMSAFHSCYRLKTVELPDSVQTIGDSAFENCETLWEIELGTGIKEIADSAFSYCYNLRKVTARGTISSIGSYAFCGDELLSFPQFEGLTSIGDSAFNTCGFETLVVPEGVQTIGDQAFAWCESLTNITLPSTLQSLGRWVFQRDDELAGVTFRNSGWQVSTEKKMTNAVDVETDNVQTNAQNFLGQYLNYYWKRKG